MNDFLKLDFNERSDQLSEIARASEFSDLWRYPERLSLEQKIATMNSLTPSQVLCTNGGDEAIMILMRIIKETSSLILPLPAFSQYTWGNESWQLNSQLISARSNLTIDLDATLAAVKRTPGAITVITRPNNPTGESIEWNKLVKLIETSKEVGGWIFLDEAYIEFSEQTLSSQASNKSNQLVSQFENLVILRTLSKAYGLAGIRLGYLIGNEKLIDEFGQRCMPFNVPQPSLQIADSALSSRNVSEMYEYCKQIKENRTILQNWLIKNGIESIKSDANFILFRVPPSQAQAIQSFLGKNGIAVRTFNRGELSGCVRVTIPYELGRLMPLLEQVLTPKLICLDMDGVLIDTSSSYDETIKATVKYFSDVEVQQQQIFELKDNGGFNNDWVLTQQLLKQDGFDISLKAVTDKFQELYLGENNDGFVANEELLIN
ncbi:MAG: histidinol-phosphate aminotransferase family protein, partial [Kangiellaceae bacterium]|nr:histidinol-phosphate aminotransferase family protein [Kangiellaceae bacterium]